MGEGVQIGPLINPAAASKVAELVQQSVAAGARVLVGATPTPPVPLLSPHHPDRGHPGGNPILDEEIFGPVALWCA